MGQLLAFVPIEGLDLARISSPFGPRVHPITKKTEQHNGIDLAYASGTPILAAHAGVASLGGNNSAGLYVVVRSGRIETHYYHMSRQASVSGKAVKAGEVLGYVGTTGASTGNHLHFGLKISGEYVDPAPYLKALMEGDEMTKESFIASLTPEEALKIYKRALEPLQDNDARAYSLEARAWALRSGLIEGDGDVYSWEAPLTREQLVTVLKRFNDLILEQISG